MKLTYGLKSIVVVALLLIATTVGANTTYYVSASGNDRNSGMKKTSPVRSMEKALELANGNDDIQVLTNLNVTNVIVTKKVRIYAAVDNIELTASNNRMFTVDLEEGDAETQVIFEGFTFAGGRSFGGDGGAILITSGNVHCSACVFEGNYAFGSGGAIAVSGENSGLSLYNCKFDGNKATTFEGDSFGSQGGAVSVRNRATFKAEYSDFINNESRGRGGCFEFSDATFVHLHFCNVRGNNALEAGAGAMLIAGWDRSEHFFASCSFTSNTCAEHGGLAMIFGGEDIKTTFVNCTISENLAESAGCIFFMSGSLELTNVTMVKNRTNSNGGNGAGIRVLSPELSLYINNSIIVGNVAEANSATCDIVLGALINNFEINNSVVGFVFNAMDGDWEDTGWLPEEIPIANGKKAVITGNSKVQLYQYTTGESWPMYDESGLYYDNGLWYSGGAMRMGFYPAINPADNNGTAGLLTTLGTPTLLAQHGRMDDMFLTERTITNGRIWAGAVQGVIDYYMIPAAPDDKVVKAWIEKTRFIQRTDGRACSDRPLTIELNTIGTLRWERSCNNGITWENITCTTATYTEEDPFSGTCIYRALNGDGTYSNQITVHYSRSIPTTIDVFSNSTDIGVVGESITFMLAVAEDDTYNYQWYKAGSVIEGATSRTYTIDSILAVDAGTYYCVVTNICNTVTSNLLFFSVSKAHQQITFPTISDKTYGDSEFYLPEKTDEGLPIIYVSDNEGIIKITGNKVEITGAGSVNITVSQAGDENYNPITNVILPIYIDKAAQQITFPTISDKTYGDAEFYLPQNTDKGLLIAYVSDNEGIIIITGNKVEITGAGNVNITASQAGDENYNPVTNVILPIYIGKAHQQITFSTIPDKTYGDADFYLPQNTDKGLPITYISDNEGVIQIIGNKVEITGAGNANITASQSGDENYNPATNAMLPIHVAKAAQQITFGTLPTKTFGDSEFELTATNNSDVPVTFQSSNTRVATVSGNTVRIVGAGETYITASSVGNNNYTAATPQQQLLTVNKGTQTVSLAVISDKIYGDEAFVLNGTSSADLPITYSSSEPTKLFISGNMANIMETGTFTVTATQSGNDNYLSASTTRTFTVNKALLTIKAENKERLYGEDNPALTYTIDGLKNGDSQSDILVQPTIFCDANKESAVGGNYDIIVSDASDNNYSFLYQNGKLTIKKAALTVKPNEETRIYGEQNPTFTLTYSGFKNEENASVLTELPVAVTNARITSNVGTYDVIISGGTATNYDLNYESSKLIIEKATLTITAEDKQREEGAENPDFALSFAGFKNNESSTVLNELPIITCIANENSPAGFYDIILSGGSDNNYVYNLVNGKLEVMQGTGIDKISVFNLSVYPNPVKQDLYIQSDFSIEKVEIYNQSGACVLINDNFMEKVDVSSLADGFYLVRIYAEGVSETRKIVVKK